MDIKKFLREAILIDQNQTYKDAVQKMIETHANSLLVVDDSGKLVWWIDVVTLIKTSIPEYLQNEKETAHFTTDSLFKSCIDDVKDKLIKDFMMSFNKVITPKTSMMEAAIIVTEWRQTKIPVLDRDLKPIWVFTRSSLKKVLASELGLS